MKKILLILMLCYSSGLFAQQTDNKHELTNPVLRAHLEEYINLTANWAKENKIPDYMICLLSDPYKNYNTITFTVVIDKAYLYKLQLSSYTEVQGTPVLIQNKADAFFENDHSVVNEVLKKYNKKLAGVEEPVKPAKENKLDLTSSTVIVSQDDALLKDVPKTVIPPNVGNDRSRPYNMELVFFNDILQSDRRYKN